MAEPLEMLADAALIVGNKSQRSQSKLAACDNLGLQLSVAEENPFPCLHLAARPDQRHPSLGVKSPREENLDFPGQMLRSRGLRSRLRMDPGAPPKQAGSNDTHIVQYDEF